MFDFVTKEHFGVSMQLVVDRSTCSYVGELWQVFTRLMPGVRVAQRPVVVKWNYRLHFPNELSK